MDQKDEAAALFRSRAGRDALTLFTMFKVNGALGPETEAAYTDIMTIARHPQMARLYESSPQDAFVALAEAKLKSALHRSDPSAVMAAMTDGLDSMRGSLAMSGLLRVRVPDVTMFADALPADGTTCLVTWMEGDVISSAPMCYAAETGDFFHPTEPARRMRATPNSDGSLALRDTATGVTYRGMIRKISDPEPVASPETDTTDLRP